MEMNLPFLTFHKACQKGLEEAQLLWASYNNDALTMDEFAGIFIDACENNTLTIEQSIDVIQWLYSLLVEKKNSVCYSTDEYNYEQILMDGFVNACDSFTNKSFIIAQWLYANTDVAQLPDFINKRATLLNLCTSFIINTFNTKNPNPNIIQLKHWLNEI